MTTVPFGGEDFTVAEQVGVLPLMLYAKAVKSNEPDNLAILVAEYELLRECIAPQDWDRFEAKALETNAGHDQMWDLINGVYEVIAARPTVLSSGSSDGQSTIEPKSTSDSSSNVEKLFPGRPDLALAALRSQTG